MGIGWNCDIAKLSNVAGRIRAWLGSTPTVAITLGSGFGTFDGGQAGRKTIRYEDLGLESCNVDGHSGILEYFERGGQRVVVCHGRLHAYEVGAQDAVMLLRAVITAGAMVHISTCAAGAVDYAIKPGDIVVVKDHVNFSGMNPLIGKDAFGRGSRFPDMTNAYDHDLRTDVVSAAFEARKLEYRAAVMVTVLGPSYETPTEIHLFEKKFGAGLVGMSTALETIAARHLGAKVIALACATNRAAGQDGPLSHEEVTRMMVRSAPVFWNLLMAIVDRLPAPA